MPGFLLCEKEVNMKLHSLIAMAALSTSVFAHAEEASADKKDYGNVCTFNMELKSKPIVKQQVLPLSEGSELYLRQITSKQNARGAKLVSNIVCQHLTGQTYTGEPQEWAEFIDRAISGLLKAGFKDVNVTRFAGNELVYQGELNNLEYQFTGEYKGQQQVIRNFAVLDKEENELITFSVSGDSSIQDKVNEEYKRLVGSFSL
ncbi:hypothetical protein W04_1113 [Pseudoalteromonas sp. SW0106-04]|nr:hypothetical protein W04_1113 [Pseudoalteromonas sp. SW0106-04]